MISREEALKLVAERCDFSLQRHLAHVAEAMAAMCRKLGYESELEKWYIIGLLHDIDWNDTINNPSEHCGDETAAYLIKNAVPEDWVLIIKSHCDFHNLARDTDIKKALVAVDEISGFCVAAALMRPTKMIGMKAKSVIKKMKDKNFAKNVSRKDMLMVEEYFDIKVDELLDQMLLPAFTKIAVEWQLA